MASFHHRSGSHRELLATHIALNHASLSFAAHAGDASALTEGAHRLPSGQRSLSRCASALASSWKMGFVLMFMASSEAVVRRLVLAPNPVIGGRFGLFLSSCGVAATQVAVTHGRVAQVVARFILAAVAAHHVLS